MAGRIAHFTAPAVEVPACAYLDTSFLLRSYFHRFPPTGGLSPQERKKNADCDGFFRLLSAQQPCTSLLAAEEAYHRLYFTAHVRRAARSKGLEGNWKQFRKRFPLEFQAARRQGVQELRRFVVFLDATPIRLVGAMGPSRRGRYLHLVKRYARLIIEKYDLTEAMDAFHIAIMRANRIDWMVTAEEHLNPGFDEISVLTL